MLDELNKIYYNIFSAIKRDPIKTRHLLRKQKTLTATSELEKACTIHQTP